MRLLHVDRDRSFRQQFRAEATHCATVACELTSASEIGDAIGECRDTTFDAVIVDPFAFDDELFVCRELADAAGRTPVIVLSKMSDDSVVVEAVAHGVHDFLFKSEAPTEWMLQRIRLAIARSNQVSRAPNATRELATVGADGRDFETQDSTTTASASELLTRTLRVLHIEPDQSFAKLAQRQLSQSMAMAFDVEVAETVGLGCTRLGETGYDLVLADLQVDEGGPIDALSRLLEQAGTTPVIAVSGGDDESEAVAAIQYGAEDFLSKSKAAARYLRRGVQLALARHAFPDQPAVDTDVLATTRERRQFPRYLLSKPTYAIPVLPDSSPAEAHCGDGMSVDVSQGGLRFEISGVHRLPTKHLVVGIEAADTVLYFATVEARHVEPIEGGLRIGAQFITGRRDVLSQANLEPQFDARTRKFRTGLSFDVAKQWASLGILRPVMFDRVLGCPQCQAVPTFRNGCRVCGSVRLHSQQLIHHFACAHVDYTQTFEQGGGISCPKCRTRDLIVGTDFEYLNGPYSCLDCGWSDTELDVVGQCLGCELRFPMHQAVEEDLIGFHVNRLDPLAFIDNA